MIMGSEMEMGRNGMLSLYYHDLVRKIEEHNGKNI